MAENERVDVMQEIRAIRAEINKSLGTSRTEHRQDIKDLYGKIEDKFEHLSGSINSVSIDVATHKSQLKTFATIVSVVISSIAVWIVAQITNTTGMK